MYSLGTLRELLDGYPLGADSCSCCRVKTLVSIAGQYSASLIVPNCRALVVRVLFASHWDRPVVKAEATAANYFNCVIIDYKQREPRYL